MGSLPRFVRQYIVRADFNKIATRFSPFNLQSVGRYGAAVQLLTILLVFILVIVLAYFATKLVAGYQKVKSKSPNIEILESYRVAPSKFIAIVRIGEKYIAVSVGKDEMSFLCELSKDELAVHSPNEKKETSFDALFSKLKIKQKETSLTKIKGKSSEY